MAMTDERATERATEKAGAERGKAVDAALLAIEKQFGRGAIMKLGSSERQAVDFIPTGSIALDLALGSAASRAAITEIFGPESRARRPSVSVIARPSGRRRLHRRQPPRPGYAPACGATWTSSRSQPDTGAGARDHETLIRSGGIDSSSSTCRGLVRGPRSKARWATVRRHQAG
jgi:recombination protein RecA